MLEKREISPQKLSPGELELIELLWSCGPMTIAGTHQAFLNRGRKIAYPTVQTRLNRLMQKGYVSRNDQHPAVYEAAVDPPDVSGRYFDLFEKLCGGNLAPLMIHLTGKRDLQPEELKILKAIIDEQEKRRDE